MLPSWKDFVEQLDVIRQAWIPFVIAVLFAIGIISAIEGWAASEIIAGKDATIQSITAGKDATIQSRDSTIGTLNERLKLKDEQLADKVKTTPPDEAKELIKKLQEQIHSERITSPSHEQVAVLEENLKIPFKVNLLRDSACDGCNPLERSLIAAFSQTKWNINNGVAIGLSFIAQSGLAVLVRDPDSLNSAESEIVSAFKKAGLGFDIRKKSGGLLSNGSDAEVVITNKTP